MKSFLLTNLSCGSLLTTVFIKLIIYNNTLIWKVEILMTAISSVKHNVYMEYC